MVLKNLADTILLQDSRSVSFWRMPKGLAVRMLSTCQLLAGDQLLPGIGSLSALEATLVWVLLRHEREAPHLGQAVSSQTSPRWTGTVEMKFNRGLFKRGGW